MGSIQTPPRDVSPDPTLQTCNMKDLATSLRGQSFVLPKLDTLMPGWPSYIGKNYEKLQAIAETKYVKYSYFHSDFADSFINDEQEWDLQAISSSASVGSTVLCLLLAGGLKRHLKPALLSCIGLCLFLLGMMNWRIFMGGTSQVRWLIVFSVL